MTMPLMTQQLGSFIGDGIDLHLGQKPKLGGGTPTIHSSIYNILSVLCISMFCFLFFSMIVLVLISTFQNTKNSKNILLCLLFPSVLVSKFENPKIFVLLLWFCKVCCRVQSPVTPLELGIHFILFMQHK
jgi:hypothetical protein